MQDPHHPTDGPSARALSKVDERNWAVIAHASTFAGMLVPGGNVLGPLVVWILKKDQMPEVGQHAKDALNFHLCLTIYLAVAAFLSVFLIGVPIMIGLGIMGLVVSILATVKASSGQRYKYPLTFPIIK